jgi:hypothetical protein
MTPVTVQDLIDFLSEFDPDVPVLINGDTGTPDPCYFPEHMEKFYTVVDPRGNAEEVGEDLIQDYLDEGFVIVKVSPVFWPAS